jgi:hypothetical protein
MISQDWSQKLRQRLSSNSNVLQSGRQADIRAADDGGLWIVGRADCVFRTLDLGAVPPNRARQVVETQIAILSPYEDPGFWMVLQAKHARIWIWDEAKRRELAADLALDAADFIVLPESCFARHQESQVHLYRGVDGVFAQHWRDGDIAGDHWWSVMPTDVEWRMFLRGSGLPVQSLDVPEALQHDRPASWAKVQLGSFSDRFIETFLVKSMAAVFMFFLVFQLTGSARLLVETWALNDRVKTVRETHQSAIAIRDLAFDTKTNADRLGRLKVTSPLRLFSEVANSLPDSSGTLVVWQLEGQTLEFVVNDTSPDLEAYVRALEATGTFSKVSVEPLPRSGQIRITSQVTRS